MKNIIFKISLRNLLRQKRRNILLGVAIAFGMSILVIANSFSHGISDLLLNRLVIFITGHVRVSWAERGRFQNSVMRDMDRFKTVITNTLDNVKEIREGIVTFGRLVGNGRADQASVIGVPADAEFLEYYNGEKVDGNVYDYTNASVENPVLMSAKTAKDLNVKVGDKLNLRTQTVSGQQQTGRLTLVATFKSSGIFESMAVYTPLDRLKTTLGYRPYETGPLQIVFEKMNNPRMALIQADKLYKALTPELAHIRGRTTGPAGVADTVTFGYFTNADTLAVLTNTLGIGGRQLAQNTNRDSALISRPLALKTGAATGAEIRTVYDLKFEPGKMTNRYRVAGIFDPDPSMDRYSLLINENHFYRDYYDNLPKNGPQEQAGLPGTNAALYAALSPEWKLLPRTATSQEFQRKMQDTRKQKWAGAAVDVSTMFEVASFVIQLEGALNMITVIAVIILFFIILIGVVNTLRMTVRERTREIGTVRAVGMQSRDVRNTFILEVVFLTLFACLAGIVLGLTAMGLLSLIKINTDSVLSILLLNRSLHFVPKASSILSNLIVIILIAAATAYFPSRRAARMKAADALRHYE